MDKTAVQDKAPVLKPIETGITDTPKHLPEPTPAPKREEPSLPHKVLVFAADLRITVLLFSLSMLLVFWGTLAQVDMGIWTVVKQYFRSPLVFVPIKYILLFAVNDNTLQIPFPGGWLIGGAMFVNLLAAHAIRFKLAWNRGGIILIHVGLIVIMVGEVITGLFAVEGNMMIKEGQTVNYVIEGGKAEFVVMKLVNEKEDEVAAVPAGRLKPGELIDDPNLPFKLRVRDYMINSELLNAEVGLHNLANAGIGKALIAKLKPEVAGVDPDQKHDAPSVYVDLVGRDGEDLKTWLFSAHLENQWIDYKGVKYRAALRFRQTTRPFAFHLDKFEHKRFAGGEKPKDFRSYVRVMEADGTERKVEIYMNAPLYYKGETFYQSSWTTDPLTGRADGTVLQVVSNPGWLLPYISCILVGLGMLWHFGGTLSKFLERRKHAQTVTAVRVAK